MIHGEMAGHWTCVSDKVLLRIRALWWDGLFPCLWPCLLLVHPVPLCAILSISACETRNLYIYISFCLVFFYLSCRQIKILLTHTEVDDKVWECVCLCVSESGWEEKLKRSLCLPLPQLKHTGGQSCLLCLSRQKSGREIDIKINYCVPLGTHVITHPSPWILWPITL